MSQEALQRLVDRAAIYDALMAYVRGGDRDDLELLKTAFHPDATVDYGRVLRGNAWELFAALAAADSRIEVAQRAISNHIVEIDGDVARSEAYFMAYYVMRAPDGERELLTFGGRYVDRFERRDGEWRIARRVTVHDWDHLEPLNHDYPERQSWMDDRTHGRRDRSDVTYDQDVP